MKLWSAIAVQLLAIALREHQRFGEKDTVHECQPVEVICNCTDIAPSISADPSWVFGSGLVVGGAVSLVVVLGYRVFCWGHRNGEVGSATGRRRGGGVLS